MKIMKKLIRIFSILIVFLVGCNDPALEEIYGDALIYMPQATHNLGTDCNLYLNLSAAVAKSNPSQKTQTTLGIYRSGTHAKEKVSVDMVINTDSLSAAQTYALSGQAPSVYDIYKSAKLLPSELYDPLPNQLTIPEGERQATTQLVLHNSEIFDQFAVGQILVLPVQIQNPTRYKINNSLSLTMVVITLTE